MPTGDEPRQTQPPPPGPLDNSPLLLVAAVAAILLVTSYLTPGRGPPAVDATGANETLVDATAAEQSGNRKQARDILLGLAKKNNAQAQLRLAEMYEVGPPDGDADLTQAASWYEKAADSGIVKAKARLGHLYLEGVGVLQDFAKAKPLLEAAASDGNQEAQFDLGRMWQHGWGGEQNDGMAYAWFELAAQQDYAPAIKARDMLLTRLSPAKVKEAQDLLEKLKISILQPSRKG